MPKLDRYHKDNNLMVLEAITDKFFLAKISDVLKAIEGFVMYSCIAVGILQMVSMKFSDVINNSNTRWLRTKTNFIVSEAMSTG